MANIEGNIFIHLKYHTVLYKCVDRTFKKLSNGKFIILFYYLKKKNKFKSARYL